LLTLSAIVLASSIGASSLQTIGTAAIVEAVDAAVAAAKPDFANDPLAFAPGEPALIGGYVRQGDILAWPLQYSTDHFMILHFAAQKKSAPFTVTIEDSEGEAVFTSEAAATSQFATFQPEPNEQYLVIVEARKSSTVKGFQVAGIVSQLARGMDFTPANFSSVVRRLIQAVKPDVDAVGYGFVQGTNLFAVPLMPGTSAGPEASEAGRTMPMHTNYVVSDGRASAFKTSLRNPDNTVAGTGARQSIAQVVQVAGEDAFADNHPGCVLRIENTSESNSLFMGGILSL
jgi:hypothetical protein